MSDLSERLLRQADLNDGSSVQRLLSESASRMREAAERVRLLEEENEQLRSNAEAANQALERIEEALFYRAQQRRANDAEGFTPESGGGGTRTSATMLSNY